MKQMIKIAFLPLCAVLLLAACDRNRHTPDPDTQKVPLSFSASSHNIPVKASTANSELSNYHKDFGVWGIARHTTYQPFILWEASPMVQVKAVEKKDPNTGEEIPTSEFVPVSGAFWVQGYAYSFIALAPYTGGLDALVDAVVTPSQDIAISPDTFSFTFDMGTKYDESDYDFDLMGSAAITPTVNVASHRGAQELNFHHLLAKINISVDLKDSKNGPSLGTVSKIRLLGVDTNSSYVIAYNAINELNVTSSAVVESQNEIIFSNDTESGTSGFQQCLNVVPQNISDYKLYIDFTLGTGANQISFTDFFIDIANATNQPTDKSYKCNEVYNWNITIGSKEDISFIVSVNPWGEQTVGGDEIDIF